MHKRSHSFALLKSRTLALLVVLSVSSCDSCSQGGSDPNILRQVFMEGKQSVRATAQRDARSVAQDWMKLYNCAVIEPFLRPGACPATGSSPASVLLDDYVVVKDQPQFNVAFERTVRFVNSSNCSDLLSYDDLVDTCLTGSGESLLKDKTDSQLRILRRDRKEKIEEQVKIVKEHLTACSDPMDVSKPNPVFELDAEGSTYLLCEECFGPPDDQNPAPYKCEPPSSSGVRDPVDFLVHLSLIEAGAALSETARFASVEDGTSVGTEGDARSDFANIPFQAAAVGGGQVTSKKNGTACGGVEAGAKVLVPSQKAGRGRDGVMSSGRGGLLSSNLKTESIQDAVNTPQDPGATSLPAQYEVGTAGSLAESGSAVEREDSELDSESLTEFWDTSGGMSGEVDPLGSEDPDDYFKRNLYESLFKRVHRKYQEKENTLLSVSVER